MTSEWSSHMFKVEVELMSCSSLNTSVDHKKGHKDMNWLVRQSFGAKNDV